jgi:hypothetical protein
MKPLSGAETCVNEIRPASKIWPLDVQQIHHKSITYLYLDQFVEHLSRTQVKQQSVSNYITVLWSHLVAT